MSVERRSKLPLQRLESHEPGRRAPSSSRGASIRAMRWRCSRVLTSSSMGRTTSRRDTWSTTPPYFLASPVCTEACCDSRVVCPCSGRKTDHAIGACIRSRLHPASVQDCQDAGVLGVMPGLVGVLQATEVIKTICDLGESLAGRLLIIDALGLRFQTFLVSRDENCPMCGTREIRDLIDYEAFCGTSSGANGIAALTPADLAPMLADGCPGRRCPRAVGVGDLPIARRCSGAARRTRRTGAHARSYARDCRLLSSRCAQHRWCATTACGGILTCSAP